MGLFLVYLFKTLFQSNTLIYYTHNKGTTLKKGRRRQKTLSTKSGPLNKWKATKGNSTAKKNCWMNLATISMTDMSVNRTKILLQETVEADEIDEEFEFYFSSLS